MKKLFGLILIALSLNCFAAEYSVQWTPEISLSTLADIPSLLEREVGEVQYTNGKDSQIAKTCNEYFKLTKAGYYPQDNMQIAAESFFKKNCDALVALQQAQPAKSSFVRNFNLQKDYGLLPASVIFPNLAEKNSPPGDLKIAYPDTEIKVLNPYSVELMSKKAAMKSIVSILGWGDFNQDGYDDILMFIANYVLDGTYHSYSIFLLTRKNADAPLLLITR